MTRRHTVDTITSDELDALYDRAEAIERLTAYLAHRLADAEELPVSTVLCEAWQDMAAAAQETP